MDIVSRLKQFIEFTGLSSSQFADRALIPRPTLSQIMNGRNKKISNELITKLHVAFPELNVMWLMFGDGNMADKNSMRFSERLKEPNLFENPRQTTDTESLSEASNYSKTLSEKNQDNIKYQEYSQKGTIEPDKPFQRTISAPTFDAAQFAAGRFQDASNIEPSLGGDRRVNYVLVFFTDGSFQVLRPAED